jgi:hypothetical protein
MLVLEVCHSVVFRMNIYIYMSYFYSCIIMLS